MRDEKLTSKINISSALTNNFSLCYNKLTSKRLGISLRHSYLNILKWLILPSTSNHLLLKMKILHIYIDTFFIVCYSLFMIFAIKNGQK